MTEKVIILDFGSQYTQLIARSVRELHVYCEIYPYSKLPELSEEVKAVILSGSPCSVTDENAPTVAFEKFIGKVPVLGICYGAQLMASHFGGKVHRSNNREYGKALLEKVYQEDIILEEIPAGCQYGCRTVTPLTRYRMSFN